MTDKSMLFKNICYYLRAINNANTAEECIIYINAIMLSFKGIENINK